MNDLRQRLRAAGKACGSPDERRNGDGTVTIDGQSYIALLNLRSLVTELDNALWRLEELEKRDAEFVTVRREKME